MQCTTCKLEYVEYSTDGTYELQNKEDNNLVVELEISVMACPSCGAINKSTLQVDID